MKNEENLLKNIKTIINESKFLDDSAIHECLEKLVEYKENGGSQQLAYEMLHELYKLYGTVNEEEKQDFVADILDIVVGFIGNRDWLIWEDCDFERGEL
ncbi:MAG: hypothetical protein FWG64_05095 [Firmicutes bacterium]|nr:hypothetical protein [Bacillota bacterium]